MKEEGWEMWIDAEKKVFVPTLLEQKNLLDKLYSYTFLDRLASYPCKKK
jgi:hypothetical protein